MSIESGYTVVEMFKQGVRRRGRDGVGINNRKGMRTLLSNYLIISLKSIMFEGS